MQRSPSMQNPVEKRSKARNLRRRKKKKKSSQRRAEGGGMIKALISVGVPRGLLPVNVGAMVSLKLIVGKRKVIHYQRQTIHIVDWYL